MEILTPVIVLGSLGIIFGLWLTFAQKIFAIKEDTRTENIFALLPGVNCGACGKAGCYGLAESLAKGDTKIIGCPIVNKHSEKEIARLIGARVEDKIREIATLICGGGKDCKDKFIYDGPEDCNIASLVMGGHKGCSFGCMGFGSCQKACIFGAISMGENGLPRIDAGKCTSCGKCVQVCPKHVLVLTPITSQYHINCSSKDKGADVMKVCKAGCIGCGKCVKACPASAIELNENLAKIDCAKCTNCGECIKVCPTKAIIRR